MLPYVRARLFLALPTLLAVTLVTFFLGYLAPGSPIDLLVGQHADPAVRARLEHEYGLDRPPLVRYLDFLRGALHGDLGRSFSNAGRPVSELIAEQFPVTAFIACAAVLLAVMLGVPAGALAALHHNRPADRAVMGLVLLFVSMPAFVLAPILMLLFALRLNWLPASGWEGVARPAFYLLPVAVLAARPAALFARIMRASMLEVVRQDYIRTALAKGLTHGAAIRRHALKNAFLPVLTVIGSSFGYLLTGSFVVENIFSIPGIGYESVQSILRRDYPVIQGVALLVAVVFIALNLAVDLLYAAVDPRVRLQGAR
ncbi:MAG: ABC transporter permease [Chthonomonadales bacterium]|nr:ABC transporter permease [Chthonomonadales bacterium]